MPHLKRPTGAPGKTTVEWMADQLQACHDDPHLFNELFVADGKHFWNRQRELVEAVVKYRTVACYSGNMVGKDFAIARLIWWWLYTRPGSLVIVTGPSQTLLGSVTWKEVRQSKPLLASARLSRGVKASPQQADLGNGWQALGFSTTSIERASGQHNPHLLVIIDEASGVEEDIYDAIESLGYERLVCIGNPIRADGRFVDLIRQGEADERDGIPPQRAVKSIQIPSTDSPHAQMERSPWGLADATWIESCYRQYGGEQSFWCRSHIHALIPLVSSQILIPEAWLDYAASIQRPALAANHPVHRTRRIAVDLSEGVGADDTAIIVRDDYGLLDCDAGGFLSLAATAAKVAALARRWNIPPERISYDGLGIGRRFHEYLVKVGLQGCQRFIGGGRPKEPTRFSNWRTEAAWKAADRLNPDRHLDDWHVVSSRQIPFHIPARAYWQLLRADLRSLTYELIGDKQVRLIKKEDLIEVLGRSPDRGDAFCQSFAFE